MDGAASLVIAITGHRDLRPEYAKPCRDEITRIFAEFTARYPHTPLLLLTGLAEGADRLAVEAARAAKVPYLAILPMPAALYRHDFVTPESVREFDEMLAGARRQIELPPAGDATFDQIAQPGEARDRQYRELGRYLVRYSQILIAVWDDQFSGKTGGTSEVVKMKLGQEASLERRAALRLNSNGVGPVYVIPTVRMGSPTGSAPSLARETRYPDQAKPADYEASYALLDQFNADVAGAGSYLPEAEKQSRQNLFEGSEVIGLSPAMEWVATVYARADSLAMRFASFSLRLWKGVFGLLALSGVALGWLNVVESIPGHETLNRGLALTDAILAGYYACLAGALGLILWETGSRRRNRHEDYRALAEALRVQFFWMAAGLPDLAAEQYLLKQAGEMVWIRDAISECGLYDGELGLTRAAKSDQALRLRLAHKWVSGQEKYFARTRARHEAKKRRLTAFATASAIVGLIAPLVGLAPHFGYSQMIETWAHTVAAVALWWAALTWNYIERRGFAQEAREYARMADLFRAADKELEKLERQKNFEGCLETIRDLGREALEENGDWLAKHRERKLAAHHAVG
jgi:hypothetical protein